MNIDLSSEEMSTLESQLGSNINLIEIQKAAVFNVMRILKRINPGDMYYEAYLGHLTRSGDEFYDTYMLLWEIGATMKPKRILEIGTRTGISLCQLLCSYIDPTIIQEIVCVDPFADQFISPHIVRANMKALNLPYDKPAFIEKGSQEALPELIADGKKFDFILVDGDHTKAVARQDLEMAHQLCSEDGSIVFDDISDAPGECGLIDVWQDFINAHTGEYLSEHRMAGKGVAWAIPFLGIEEDPDD